MNEDRIKKWKNFINGCWQRKMPDKPGTYPVTDREGNRAGDRLIVITKQDKLYDPKSAIGVNISEGGTSWKGYWWSEPYPSLPRPPKW